MSDPIVIAGLARTPMGGFQGELSGATASQLGAVAIKAALERAGVAADDVDEVLMGNVLGAGHSGGQRARGGGGRHGEHD
jgi:acetyl-CoA C-acetyltransferase